MIQRREFISSVASLAALAAIGGRARASSPAADRLNWRSTVIETVAHTKHERKPVVTGVSLQTNGPLLSIVGVDHYVCLYHVAEGRFVEHLKEHTDWVRAAKFSPNGKRLVTCGNDRKILFWDTENWSRPIRSQRSPEAVIDLSFSTDGSKVAAVGFDNQVRLYRTKDGGSAGKLSCQCSDNHAIAFSKDDSLVAAGGRSGVISIWDASSMKKVSEFKAHKRRIRAIEFTPDNRIVSAGDDQVVRLTNAGNTEDYRILERQSSKIFASKVLDPQLIATSGSDNLIKIWNANSGQEVGSLAGHTGTVSSLDVSADLLVSGSFDTTVRIWQREQDASTLIDRQPANQRHSNKNNGWSRRLK